MERNEAIALLAACKPLADRLAAQGVNIKLTNVDRIALDGFKRIWNYKGGFWLDDPETYRQAGLQKSDIHILTFMLDWVQIENMGRQHEGGEQLDG